MAARTLYTESELDRIVRRIVETYDPDKIILFGSYAYGLPDRDSDFDLFIIKETTESSRERVGRVLEAVWPLPVEQAIEPYVVTRAELQERLRFGDQFVQKIVRHGQTLYDRDPITHSQIQALVEGTQPMKPEDSPIPGEWYQMAERDLAAGKVLLGAEDELLVPAGVFLQQAVEKHLKGYLLSKGWELVRTHDLRQLLDDLTEHESDFAEFTATCSQITKFYLENRYALKSREPITRGELERLFVEAENLIARIKDRAAPPPPPPESPSPSQ